MAIKEKDRVIYVSNQYRIGYRNPLWGSKYQCIGTVTTTKLSDSDSLIIRVKWDNGTNNNYRESDLKLYKEIKKGMKMDITVIKETAKKAYEHVKPYEKYIGLVALAVVIDHFFLENKFSSRFKAMAEGVVSRITDAMDHAIDKLKPNLELSSKETEEKTPTDGGE